MKARLITYFSISLFMIFFYGCRSACEIGNRAEGFDKEILRVYVRIDKSEIPGQYANDNHKYVMMMAERRAVNLLESYIALNPGDADGKTLRTGKIQDVVKNGVMVCEACNDDYCEAFIDYNAGACRDKTDKKQIDLQ